MTARAILHAAAESGVLISLHGGSLAVEASTQPSDELLSYIKEHKAGLVELLRNDPALEHEAALVATELAAMNAVEARFQAELELLRGDNARAYSSRTPWQVKW
jgi:hypothetical protein